MVSLFLKVAATLPSRYDKNKANKNKFLVFAVFVIKKGSP